MERDLMAADEIYNAALQIMNSHDVDAKSVPLIAATVAHRLDAFALGAMSRELAALREKTTETTTGEVDNG